MELIPSVLETKQQSGVQVFSVDGYASIERHGSVDSIVLSEFAFDRDIFEQKLVDNELYYYGHEKQRTEERRRSTSSSTARRRCEVCGRCSRAGWR